MAKQLRKDAANADDQTLKKTVTDLGAEFESLGGKLTDLTGLQNFDTTELDKRAKKVGELCGATPAPVPSGGRTTVPSPTASD